jgi:hypothetical protein
MKKKTSIELLAEQISGGLIVTGGYAINGQATSIYESFTSDDVEKIKGAMKTAKNLMALPKELEKVGFSKREINVATYDSPMPPVIISITRGGKKYVFLNKKYADGPDVTVGDIAGGLMNESTSLKEAK